MFSHGSNVPIISDKLKRSFYKSDFRVLLVNSPLSDPF